MCMFVVCVNDQVRNEVQFGRAGDALHYRVCMPYALQVNVMPYMYE